MSSDGFCLAFELGGRQFVIDEGAPRGVEHGPAAGDAQLGVVFVCRGNTEDTKDGVADELLDDAAVGFDLSSGHRGVACEHPVNVFRVGRLGAGREADEVAEERGHHLALLAGRRSRIR